MAELVEGEASYALAGIRRYIADTNCVLDALHVPVGIVGILCCRPDVLIGLRIEDARQNHSRHAAEGIVLVVCGPAHLVGDTRLTAGGIVSRACGATVGEVGLKDPPVAIVNGMCVVTE